MERQIIRLTEQDLHKMIAKAVNRIVETRLDYDVDNFSGKWYMNPPQDYVDSEGYLDDPNHVPNEFDDDEWVDGDKGMETDYSWEKFDDKPIAKGVGDFYTVGKRGVPRDVDNAQLMRKRRTQWTDKELSNRDRMMGKYIQGKRGVDDVGDSWNGIHD